MAFNSATVPARGRHVCTGICVPWSSSQRRNFIHAYRAWGERREFMCWSYRREVGEKIKLHSSFLAHSTSQLVVCLPCTQFFLPPAGHHTTSAPCDISCLFLCATSHPVLGITHLWLPSAARCFPPSLHRCKCTDRGRLALPALSSTFPCRQASPLTWGSDFLP